jgi:DNA-binding GntR family transcriptional regulator
MITFQELPPGASVSESSLMEKLGYGRTPVREAPATARPRAEC